MPIKQILNTMKPKLLGYYRYYGITDNGPMLSQYWYITMKLLFKWINRRSQRKSYTWEKFLLLLKKIHYLHQEYMLIYSHAKQTRESSNEEPCA